VAPWLKRLRRAKRKLTEIERSNENNETDQAEELRGTIQHLKERLQYLLEKIPDNKLHMMQEEKFIALESSPPTTLTTLAKRDNQSQSSAPS